MGTLKLKSTAGGSVSLAVDDTLATDEIIEIPSEGIQPLDVNHGIESGSTDNGTWIKFPEGTLICRFSTASSLSSEVLWTFPVPFVSVSDLVLAGAPKTSAAYSIALVFKIPSVSDVDFSTFDSGNARLALGVGLIAIGRWK